MMMMDWSPVKQLGPVGPQHMILTPCRIGFDILLLLLPTFSRIHCKSQTNVDG